MAKEKKVNRPDYRVSTPVEVDDEKTRWTNIGVGFEGKKGIMVYMDAVPINGKLFISGLTSFAWQVPSSA